MRKLKYFGIKVKVPMKRKLFDIFVRALEYTIDLPLYKSYVL